MFPFESRAVTVRLCAAPAVCVVAPLTWKWVAAPGSTVKVALVPEARASPLVREAVSETPLSAFV